MDEFYEIKIVVIGAQNTGKTLFCDCLTKAYEDLNFQPYQTSFSATFRVKKLIYNNNLFKLNVWDTVGQERYTALTKIFFKDSDIILIFYNYHEKQTFERAKFFIDYTKRESVNENCIYFLICNKYDMNLKSKDYENIVPDEEAIEIAKKNNMIFRHLSTFEKYSNGINELFKKALKEYTTKKNISN